MCFKVWRSFRWLSIYSFLLVCGLSACTTFVTKTVVYSESELNAKLNPKLLVEKNILRLYRLKTLNPKVSLLPDQNRVQVGVDLELTNILNLKQIKGNLLLSGNLSFDPQYRRVLLKQPKLEKFILPDLDQAVHFSASQVLTEVVNKNFDDLVVYELKPEDLKYLGMQFDPKEVIVKPEGLSITVAPR